MGTGQHHLSKATVGLSCALIAGLTWLLSAPVWSQGLQDKITFANSDINNVWARQFQRLGRSWVMPKAYIYTDHIRTPCGMLGNGNAQYCPRNHAIYLNQPFVYRVNRRVGDFAVVTILAHEYGHAVQRLLGLAQANRYPVQDELQADCFAGVYAQDAMGRGLLDASDIPEATVQSYNSGEPTFQWNSHGTSQQRVTAFRMGYLQGFQACLSYSNL
jgi:predicted metalloprotease